MFFFHCGKLQIKRFVNLFSGGKLLPFYFSIMSPAAFAVYTIKVTYFFCRRQKVNSKRYPEPPTSDWSEDYLIKQECGHVRNIKISKLTYNFYSLNQTSRVTDVSGRSLKFCKSKSCRSRRPGFFPDTIFPKMSSFPSAFAPLIVAQRIRTSRGIAGKCC